jgi:glycine hydroxymethyltransferase
MRGPRGGCIVSRNPELGPAIDKAVMPGMQGGPLDHVIAAKAVGFHEAAQPSFKEHVQQVVKNASSLAKALAEAGHRLVSGGTDTHLMLVDLRQLDPDLSGRKARNQLGRAGISLNENTVPDDPRPPYQSSGLRIGTPAETTAGMREPEMARVAELIDRALRAKGDDTELAAVREDVAELCSKFEPYPGLAG